MRIINRRLTPGPPGKNDASGLEQAALTPLFAKTLWRSDCAMNMRKNQ